MLNAIDMLSVYIYRTPPMQASPGYIPPCKMRHLGHTIRLQACFPKTLTHSNPSSNILDAFTICLEGGKFPSIQDAVAGRGSEAQITFSRGIV